MPRQATSLTALRRIARSTTDPTLFRYVAIGLTGVGLDTLTFSVLVFLGVAPVAASVMGYAVGTANSYFLNSWFNFRRPTSIARGTRFAGVALAGMSTSGIMVAVLIEVGMQPLPAKCVTIPFVVIGQFLANKYWTFAMPRAVRDHKDDRLSRG